MSHDLTNPRVHRGTSFVSSRLSRESTVSNGRTGRDPKRNAAVQRWTARRRAPIRRWVRTLAAILTDDGRIETLLPLNHQRCREAGLDPPRGAWTVTRDPATGAMLLHWPDGTAEPLSLPARLTGRNAFRSRSDR